MAELSRTVTPAIHGLDTQVRLPRVALDAKKRKLDTVSATPQDKNPTQPGSSENEHTSQLIPEGTHVQVRRAPKIWVFLLLGALLGVLVALLLVNIAPGAQRVYQETTASPQVGRWSAFGYFAVLFGIIGLILGGAVAIVLDWWSTRTLTQGSLEQIEEQSSATSVLHEGPEGTVQVNTQENSQTIISTHSAKPGAPATTFTNAPGSAENCDDAERTEDD